MPMPYKMPARDEKRIAAVKLMIRALCAANVLAKGRRGELLKMISSWAEKRQVGLIQQVGWRLRDTLSLSYALSTSPAMEKALTEAAQAFDAENGPDAMMRRTKEG